MMTYDLAMKDIKTLGKVAAVILAFMISGCAWVSYTPYAGQQQKWPTAAGSFVAKKDGILIYRGLPDRPYTILGEAVIDQYPQYMDGAIAHAAHVHKADAAMIVGKQAIYGGTMNCGGGSTTYYNGQTTTSASGNAYVSGNSVTGNALINSYQSGTANTIQNPSYSAAISWDRMTIYLIKFLTR